MKNLQLVVSTLVAIIGLGLIVRSTTLPADGYMVDTAPTPYSHDHSVAQLRATEEGHAATF